GAGEDVLSGAEFDNGVVASASTLYALGTVSGALVNGGNFYLFGSATSTTVISDGLEDVDFGSYDFGALLAAGGRQVVGGTAVGTVINGGMQTIEASGSAIGAVLSSGFQLVDNGGVASGTVVSSGASELVLGMASDTTISSGGYELVVGGGTAAGDTIDGG